MTVMNGSSSARNAKKVLRIVACITVAGIVRQFRLMSELAANSDNHKKLKELGLMVLSAQLPPATKALSRILLPPGTIAISPAHVDWTLRDSTLRATILALRLFH
jgi:hypothetical protein